MPVLPDGTHLPYPGDPAFSQLPPQAQAMIQQLAAAQGGQGGAPGGMPPGPPPGMSAGDAQQGDGGDWLVNAINSVHDGMIHEGDPKQVSLLGAILNQLTTFQANQASAAQGPQGG